MIDKLYKGVKKILKQCILFFVLYFIFYYIVRASDNYTVAGVFIILYSAVLFSYIKREGLLDNNRKFPIGDLFLYSLIAILIVILVDFLCILFTDYYYEIPKTRTKF